MLTRWTVRAAFALYVSAMALRLGAGGPTRWDRAARAIWAAGCVAFAVHVACAFHFFHAWSHADAYRQTARQTAELTGVASGFGLYLNYVFLIAWVIDVARMWLRDTFAPRRRSVAVALHAFFAFMWFNATVVFPTGPTRWAGVAAFGLLGALLARRVVTARRRVAEPARRA